MAINLQQAPQVTRVALVLPSFALKSPVSLSTVPACIDRMIKTAVSVQHSHATASGISTGAASRVCVPTEARHLGRLSQLGE